MPRRLKTAQLRFVGAEPMQLVDELGKTSPKITDEQKRILRRVGSTIKTYVKTAEALLQGKYNHIRAWAPPHLANPSNVLVACCPSGVVVRYEKGAGKKQVVTAWLAQDLPSVASLLSQRLVHLSAEDSDSSEVGEIGLELSLFKESAATKERTNIATAKLAFEAKLAKPESMPAPPQKPFFLSVRNTLEIQMLGETIPSQDQPGERQRFIARGSARLPVGWECIEVFPFFDLKHWNPRNAPVWAESDLLAAVVAQQFREAKFNSLDPNVAARKQFEALLKEYRELLDSDPGREQILQSYLQDHPVLLSPTYTEVWPKLSLGPRATDFVFRDPLGDYLLVELEPSSQALFLKNGHSSRELNHARGQIMDWKRYLEDNLSTVQRELGLTGISSNPKSLIVIGRSRSLSPDNRRKLITLENESPRLKIMTYDDVYENAKAVVENLLGPLFGFEGNTQIYYLREKTQESIT